MHRSANYFISQVELLTQDFSYFTFKSIGSVLLAGGFKFPLHTCGRTGLRICDVTNHVCEPAS